MTKEQVVKKTEHLIDRCAESMKQGINDALLCGALNIERYDDGYLLPKIILTALLMKEKDRHIPDSEPKNVDEIKNLYLMM